MNRKQELAKNTAILTVGKLLTKIISFLLLPLYTALLSTEDYGAYDVLITYGMLLLPLVNWQFGEGLFRFMLDCRGNKEKQSELFSTLLLSSFAQSSVFLLLFYLIKPFLNIENAEFLLIYVILHVFTDLLMQFVRGLGSTTKYAVASFITASATTAFNVIALAIFGMGLPGLYVSTILAQMVTLVYLLKTSRFWQYFSCKRAKFGAFKMICGYSIPLIPNNLAWWVVNASNRTVITRFLGLAANGIYTVANKFPTLFIQFYNILNLSWTETVSLHYGDEDRDSFLSDTITDMFKMFSSFCFIIIAAMPFVFPIMVNERFADAYNHIYVLLLAMLFRVLVGLYSCVYVAEKKVNKIAMTSITAAVINLSLDLLLVNHIQIYAASISTLVTFIAMFIVRYVDVNKSISMKIHKKVVVGTTLLGCLNFYSYYSDNTILQLVVLSITTLYAVVFNLDMMRSGVELVKKKVFGRG